MTINLSRVRLSSGAVEIKEVLEIGTPVVFQGTGEVTSKTVTDNHDGTENVLSLIKTSFVEIQKTDGEIVHKDIIKSKSIRSMCYAVAQELGESPEGLYEIVKEKSGEFLERYKNTKMGL